MKKPEPCPVVNRWRGRSPRRPGIPSGRPNRRKKYSNGEFCPDELSSPPSSEVCGPAPILTRTEITAGFTFSTISANPAGRCADCAYAGAVKEVRLELGPNPWPEKT